MTIRPTWDEYFMLQAKLAASRSTCNSRPQGAVLVRDNRVLATGYNGALPGQEHCLGQKTYCPECYGSKVTPNTKSFDGDFLGTAPCSICDGTGFIPYCHRRATNTPDGQKDRACRSSHAEANAIAQAARMGIAVHGVTLYCTTRPCAVCMKLLCQAGVRQIYYELDYDDPFDWPKDKFPMVSRLVIRPKIIELAKAMLDPDTSRRRLGRTE